MFLAPSFASLSECCCIKLVCMVIPGLKKETACYIVMNNYVVKELLRHRCIAVIHRGKKRKTCIALNNVACRGYVPRVEHLSLAPVQAREQTYRLNQVGAWAIGLKVFGALKHELLSSST
jgi:hypothetical protein